jgi:hypothetical protein
MGKRVRFRLWEAAFCSATFNKDKTDKDSLLTSLRVRLAFGAVLEFSELSSEALRLLEASEGAMGWSELVVMVDVMFIDKTVVVVTDVACVERVGGKASGVVCRGSWSFPSNRGLMSDFQLLSHAHD